MKCEKCKSILFKIQVIPCCDDCDSNNAWDEDMSELKELLNVSSRLIKGDFFGELEDICEEQTSVRTSKLRKLIYAAHNKLMVEAGLICEIYDANNGE